MAKKKDVIALKLVHAIMKMSEDLPLHPGEVEQKVFDAFDEWQEVMTGQMTEMVKQWETEVPDDTSLYSLGLRRAIDVVRGDDPLSPTP